MFIFPVTASNKRWMLCVCDAKELWQPKLVSWSNKETSKDCSKCTVVYALLVLVIVKRACYLCNMYDLSQEIHPVMTEDDVYEYWNASR